MVRFEKDKMIIEIESSNPVENWKDIVQSLLNLLQNQRDCVGLEPFDVYSLLKEMLPNDEYCGQLDKLINPQKQ